jgi:hypothetical protein
MTTARVGRLFPSLATVQRQQLKEEQAAPRTFTATKKQAEIMDMVMSRKFEMIGFGGGIRGTKTFTLLGIFITLARIFPRSRWAIVRRDLPTLRRNVVPSMEKIRLMSGGFVGELNQSIWTYPCANGSQILLFPEQFIPDPELERWKGLEVNGIGLEEASELSEKAANKAIERAGSWVVPGLAIEEQPHPIVLATFNPCANWPRKWFYEPYEAGTLKPPIGFVPLTILDNPFVPEAYKESLKKLPKEEYDRFVKGEWNFIDNPRQLIKTEWLWEARNVEEIDGPTRIGVDVARYGDDATSIIVTRGNALRQITNFKKFDNIKVAQEVLNQAGEYGVLGPNTRIDGIGNGSGVIDYCRFRKLYVKEIISGGKVITRKGDPFRYKDLRSQMWWETRERFRLGQLSLIMFDKNGQEIPVPQKLLTDLASPEYEISGDKVVWVEPKDTPTQNPHWGVKNRLGRSPDDGEAYINSIFDFPPEPRAPILPGTAVMTSFGGR